MKRKRKAGTRILTLLLAFSMTASVFGTTPVYAMEPAAVNIETAGQEAAQSETQSEQEDVQEEVKEEESAGTPSIHDDTSGYSVKNDGKDTEDSNGNPEQPRAPANELLVTDEGNSNTSTVETEQADTFAVAISGIEHAEASASVEAAAEGDSVIITVKPEEGYQIQSFCAGTEDGTELEYSSEADEQNRTVLYTFIMPAGAVTVDIVMEEASQDEVAVSEIGENIEFAFDQTVYQPGDTVTAVLTPGSGYDVDLESIVITDAAGTAIEHQTEGPDENGAVTLTFQATETDMTVRAEASPWPRYYVTVTTEALEADSAVFHTSVEPQDLYEGAEATVAVDYTGDQIWTATVTYGEDDTDLDFSLSSSGVTFVMPAADVEVVLSEREDQNLGDLSADDSSIAGDWQGNTSSTEKEYEPDVELSKSARWTDIEDGYAELTITEKDTSDYSNIPVDYIIILDRTRTMSLSNMTWEQGGYPDIVNENSPCINPDHYYYKGGISLSLVDYYTGFDSSSGIWFDDLSGGASSWTKRHYNASGQQISVSYGNGCQDRLTMAKQAVYELVDQIAEDNADVPAGKIKSRVAFWSFADGTYYGNADSYRIRGLYNYTPWTENYAAVKTAVSEVKTFSGTYYTESLKEAYDMITERNRTDSEHADVYTKVVFISDGVCGDPDWNTVRSYANRIKALPNTDLFTLAIGMPSGSEGAEFLAELATQKTDGTYTANFWQNLSFSGGTGSALAETLFSINDKAGEIKAVNKVLTDQIETEYWEPVEVVSADGGTSAVTLDKSTGKLTWNVPEGAGQTYSCTVRLKLKDEYRYLLSDTSYPTNRDAAGAASDLTKAGAVMSYTIEGGIYNRETRKTGVVTPKLKYGTVEFTGKKNWTVDGSRTDSVTVRLMRTLPSQTTAIQVNNAVTNASRSWAYAFDVRVMPDGSTKPLIKYDELGRTVQYEVTETVPEYYTKLENITTAGKTDENGGSVTDSQLFNEPFKVKAQLKKVDEETGNPLSGAVFHVYAWSERAGEYVPYRGTTDSSSKPYETGTMTGASLGMALAETEKGVYLTPSWLYYSPDNQGKFRIVETLAPEGYFGDWKDDAAVEEDSTDADKNVYDFEISPDAAQNQSTITITNNQDGTFEDQRTLGKITFTKNDLEAQDTIPQGDAALTGAEYGLYAAEDIVHQDQSGTVLYRKGEEIKVGYVGAENGVRTYRYDEDGTAAMTVGAGYSIIIEDLELGSYYLQEKEAGKGYLADPDQYKFEIVYKDEKTPIVEVSDYQVYEQVKKQVLSFYKVTGTDNADRLDPMEGAKFSIYLVSELAGGKYADVSDEDLPQAMIDDFRDPTALDYSAFRQIRPAIVYEEADSPDVESGKLVKSITYSDGTTYRISDYTDNENAYFAAELESDDRGIVTTPGLPYGRYVVIETTTPENTTATRPFVINVQADDEDGTVDGDGQGTPLDDLVILMDRPVVALVRIEKVDSQNKKPVLKEGASYLIHDVDGAWFDYYTAEMTTAQKNAYKEQYGDLVVQYSQGVYLGTEENPFTTKLIQSETDETANVYIETPQELPAGTYELEELSAPEGYVLQGHEGVIAKDASIDSGNRTYYETEEDGAWEETPQGVTRFIVSSGEAVYDSSIGAYIVTARQQNDPAIGKISIYAEGERLVSAKQEGSTILTRLGDALSSFFGYVKGLIGLDVPDEQGMTAAELSEYKDYVFTYEMRPIEGAEFEIRAAEDIYSPEGGANAELLYSAGELVVTLTTDADGQTWTGQEDWEGTDIAKGLPLGTYTVTQTVAGEGFALSEENAKPREIEISYAGQEVPVIYRDTSYSNPRQKVQIAIEKQDQETEEALAGAVFGLYAAEDIQNYRGKTVVKAGTLIATAETTAETDTAGTSKVRSAVFAPDLPLGQYYVKELKAPYGYATSDTRINVDASYRDDQREVISLTETVKNAPIRVQVNLMDYYTEVELDGAQMTVLDEDGNVFTTFLTIHEDNPVLRGLEIGKTYTLKELVSPEGYHYNLYIREEYETSKEGIELEKTYADASGAVTDSVKFTVLDEEELQIVSVFNKPLLGELTIEKTGEEATGTTSTTDENGNLLETPVYEIKGLPGAEYVLRAKEDIKYPDGYTGTLFATGSVVLDEYAAIQDAQNTLLRNYKLEIVDNIGGLADVSAYLGVKYEADASEEEIEAFYAEHGADVERQIPSVEEIADNETRFEGTPVSYVLRTNEDGLVRLSGLPLGEYEIIEVKAPTGYYRDKTECIQTVTVAAPEEISGRPEELVSVEVQYENAKQEIETPPETPETPKPTEIVYHPDVTITKRADRDVYDPGETVTYHITVSNTGDVDLENLRVDDSLAGGQMKAIEHLAVGETCAFDYEYRIPDGAAASSRIDNTVHVIGTPVIPEPGTDEYGQPIVIDPSSYTEPEDLDLEKVFVHGADIIVKKTADRRIYAPGDTASYTIEVINPNAYELTDVLVRDSLGGSFKQTEADGITLNEDGTVSIAVLPGGGKVSLRYEYQIPEDASAGQIENLVIATGESTNPEYRKPAISIIKKAEKYVYKPEETVKYTLTVTNTGNVDLEHVKVEDSLIGGTWVDSPDIGDLAIGESVTLAYQYTIPEDAAEGEKIRNVAVATGTTVPNPEDPEHPGSPEEPEEVKDTDEEEVTVENGSAPAIDIIKSVDKKVLKPGGTAVYTLIVTNTGNTALTDVAVTDSNVDMGAEGSIGDLAAGESRTITYEFTVSEDAVNGTVLPNTASVTGTEELSEDSTEEPRTVEDTDEKEIRVETEQPVEDEDEEIILVRNPKISITKKAEKQVYKPGETARYTILVTNTGDCTLTDVSVKEQLLTEGIFTDSTKGTFEGTLAEIGSLAVGESVSLIFEYQIPEDAKDGTAIYNIVTTEGTTEPAADPIVPEFPDGTPNYLPEETVSDRDDEVVYVETVPAGMAVTKYSVDEGVRTEQAGAEFTLYAAEEVKNLHGTAIYTAGQEIETAISGEDGIAHFITDVPVGVYRIAETKAPAGHYSSGKEIVFEVNKAQHNDNIHYLSFSDYVENAITAVHVKLVDDMTGNELAGASLQVTDPTGTPVEAWVTKTSDGYTIKGLNPDTQYTITETMPRDGYLVEFTGASMTSENGVMTEPHGAQVSFMLTDVQTGATEEGKIDKTTISEMTRIILENPFVTGEVRVNKDGEMLESWTLLDKAAAFVKSLFHYEKEALEGVEFTVYAAEDIMHPDGVIGLAFHKGDIVATGVRSIQSPAVRKTDNLGVVSFEGMYLGSYEIVETATAEGFVRDTEPRAFTLAYVDGYTNPVPAVEGSFAWTNPRQELSLKVLKTDLETGEPLAGAVIGLYAEEDIQNAEGSILVRSGTLLESSETGADGLAYFESDLPVGYRYAVQEISAPEGYLKSEQKQEFNFAYAGDDTGTVQISLSIENQPNDVQIEVEKYAPEQTKENETLRFAIEKVRNAGNCTVDNFTLTDRLPAQVKLTELQTGTFEGMKTTGSYSIWYQTNQNGEYRLWRSDIRSDTNMHLTVSGLNLADGEEVTAFQYRFGTVNKGFTELEKPEYLVQVKTGLSVGEEIVNRIELTGDKLGVTYTTEDETLTRIDKPETTNGGGGSDSVPTALPPVQTGDRSGVLIWCIIAVTAVIAVGIIVWNRCKNRRKE